jgi:aminoglycoside N3'-acetyltransferase
VISFSKSGFNFPALPKENHVADATESGVVAKIFAANHHGVRRIDSTHFSIAVTIARRQKVCEPSPHLCGLGKLPSHTFCLPTD